MNFGSWPSLNPGLEPLLHWQGIKVRWGGDAASGPAWQAPSQADVGLELMVGHNHVPTEGAADTAPCTALMSSLMPCPRLACPLPLCCWRPSFCTMYVFVFFNHPSTLTIPWYPWCKGPQQVRTLTLGCRSPSQAAATASHPLLT
jgi:hypothetical protein